MTKNSTKIICIIQNKTDEPVLSNYGMSITLKEVKESKPRTKFYSINQDKVFTSTSILNYIRNNSWQYMTSVIPSIEDDYRCFSEFFGKLELIKKIQVMRDGKIHNFECEFAKGDSCNCWCGEKYHGMMGAKL
jgi:hypothetical protein